MKKFQVISKDNCRRCDLLKDWLKTHNLEYEEWNFNDEKIQYDLLREDEFIQTFCATGNCQVYTPVIRLDETGEYHYKQLFNQMGVREKFIKELLQIDN